jgi:hypothetical protein
MATIPSANVSISAEAGALAGGTGYCVVIAPVTTNADGVPRVYSSAKALLAQHGYSPGAGYAALHIEGTRKPVIFVGVPAATAGAVVEDEDAGVTGTSAVTTTVDAGGAREAVNGIFRVTTGGTIGVSGIAGQVSADGGRTFKAVRIGTGNSFAIPYLGITLNFGAGTLAAGDVYTFVTSAPMWDADGIADARVALAEQQKLARSWVVVGEVADAAELAPVTAAVNAYETANQRFTYARVQARDVDDEATIAAYVSAIDAAFASVDGQKRVDIGVGFGRVQCPITGWYFRRPAAWAASIREYQHDVHTATWRKEDGPLLGWSLEDADGAIVEYDERTDGGALAAKFTCLRTWGNGPNGAFVAMSMTRDTEGSVLSFTHNLAVANVACTVVQRATENAIGKSLVLNADGTATTAARQLIEESVNTDLQQALLREFVPGEGPRASLAKWTMGADDVLSGTDATLTGVAELVVNGTIVHANTVVRVR